MTPSLGLTSSNRHTSSGFKSLSALKTPQPSPKFKPPRFLQFSRITHSLLLLLLLLLEYLTIMWLQSGLRCSFANLPGTYCIIISIIMTPKDEIKH
ncbi:hypothetical protein LINPERPRIM_LOCUS31562 [Linum perenne]